MTLLLLLAVISSTQAAQLPRATPQFSSGVKVGTVTSHDLTEASGLCASRQHSNVLYTHNDSGDYSHRIYAIDARSGRRLANITIDSATEHDWEDIACGPCGGPGSGNCIYLADTGGNAGGPAANIIYRIREPVRIQDQHVPLNSSLKFSWDQNDCETIMVDPRGEVYIVSKVWGGRGKFVQLPSSAWGNTSRTIVNGGVQLDIHTILPDPVGGDISPQGTEVLIKTYWHVYYWPIPDGNYYAGMVKPPVDLPYNIELQGESVCWNNNGTGYFTLAEGANAPLYYYHRNGSPNPIVGK